jgi:hypothetical protein
MLNPQGFCPGHKDGACYVDDGRWCSFCQKREGWTCDTCGERKLKRHKKHECATHPDLGLKVCLECSIFYRAESRRRSRRQGGAQ